MTWGLASIRSAYFKGIDLGASHMIVSHNTVDFDQMATYVMPGEDPREVFRSSDAHRSGFRVVDECYRYELGWESQSKERRAKHWEWEPLVPSE